MRGPMSVALNTWFCFSFIAWDTCEGSVCILGVAWSLWKFRYGLGVYARSLLVVHVLNVNCVCFRSEFDCVCFKATMIDDEFGSRTFHCKRCLLFIVEDMCVRTSLAVSCPRVACCSLFILCCVCCSYFVPRTALKSSSRTLLGILFLHAGHAVLFVVHALCGGCRAVCCLYIALCLLFTPCSCRHLSLWLSL